ncbi:hypothetical protein [Thalassobium sp. R2A62]|uniref:hypothetical protein n=1 Tax=Thalassobium sp. R2A62 TaxID=633131 RepID=UPI0001B1CBD8|nr:hypothetical protein [Thalassobium sp. R2A62]EET47404.1 hypothetical protein TR2A62_0846 [Thalassobium sp. R2A62]
MTPAEGDFVTRASSGQIGELSQIANGRPLSRTENLSPEQMEIMAFFERTARELNANGSQQVGDDLKFDHFAIDQLDVRYFYTVERDYSRINPRLIMQEQQQAIQATVCADETLKLLATDYGFVYSYNYLSLDQRLIDRLFLTPDQCDA